MLYFTSLLFLVHFLLYWFNSCKFLAFLADPSESYMNRWPTTVIQLNLLEVLALNKTNYFLTEKDASLFFLLSQIREYQQLLMTMHRELEIHDRSCWTPLLCFSCMCFVAAGSCYTTRHRARLGGGLVLYLPHRAWLVWVNFSSTI